MTDTSARDADAIRYAVLRKLASAMRHTLVSELQTIQFAAELAARMLDTGATGPRLAECLERMSGQTRAAIDSARSTVDWLRPDANATTTVGEALRRCLRVAGDDWSLRAIEASVDVRTGDAHVSRAVSCELLVISLLALIDTHPGPIDIEVEAESEGEDAVIRLRAKPANRTSPFPPVPIYRTLTYEDVMIVSSAHGVACTVSDGAVALRLRTVPAIA